MRVIGFFIEWQGMKRNRRMLPAVPYGEEAMADARIRQSVRRAGAKQTMANLTEEGICGPRLCCRSSCAPYHARRGEAYAGKGWKMRCICRF